MEADARHETMDAALPRAGSAPAALARFLGDMARIRRVEFLVAEIPIVAIPLLLAARDPGEILRAPIARGIALFFLLFNFGDMINCLADRDLDALYKTHLSRSVYRLGVRFVAIQVAACALLALALATHLSLLLGHPVIVVLVVLGLLQGAAYSVEPVRLKRRGPLGLLCLWLIIFVGPMMLVSTLLRPWPPPAVVLVACAYGALQMGIILVNTAEDFAEDLASGVRTTIVVLGLPRGIGLALGLVLAGGAGLLGTLASLAAARHVPAAAWASLALPAAAIAVAARGVNALRVRIFRAESDRAVLEVKRSARWVPLWVTLVAWTTLAASMVLFVSGGGATR
ncbi:MAG: UbiA family prenyltransferase [Acidobacteriota bacterium]